MKKTYVRIIVAVLLGLIALTVNLHCAYIGFAYSILTGEVVVTRR